MSQDKDRAISGDFGVYTLDEASESKRCSIASILKMAADGRILLCTTIPIGWEIYNIENNALPACQYKKNSLVISSRPGENAIGTIEKADPTIELLTLSAEDCKNIKTHGHANQGAFSEGLKTAYNHPPIKLIPTRTSFYSRQYKITDCLPIFSRCFAVCKKPTPKDELINWDATHFPYQEITIFKNMIRITQNELEKILESTEDLKKKNTTTKNSSNNTSFDKKTNQNLKNISNRPYSPGRARTKLLETLYQTSKISWEIYRATGKYPSNLKIEKTIKKICPKCSVTLAKKSATMIRPPAENQDLSSEYFLTNYFWALIDTYEKYYHKPAPKDEIDKEDILGWLENDLKFGTSLALDGSRIIDPEFEANKDNAPIFP